MIDTPVIPVTISKEAYELIVSGKAIFSSGGIRDAQGHLKGLYTLCSDTDIFQNPMDFVQNSQMTASISKVIEMDKSITLAKQILDSTNVGLNALLDVNILNSAITVAGFAIISRQIDNVAHKIDRLADQMKKYHIEDKSLEIKELIANMISVGDILSNRKLNENDILTIEKLLNKTQVMMEWLITQFEESSVEVSGYLFELLYNLSVVNADILKEYGAQYYYKYNKYPANYSRWVNTLKYVTHKKVINILKRTVFMLNPTAMPDQISKAVNVTLNTINLKKQDLLEYKKIVPKLPMEAHFDMARYVETQLKNGNYIIDDNAKATLVFE